MKHKITRRPKSQGGLRKNILATDKDAIDECISEYIIVNFKN